MNGKVLAIDYGTGKSGLAISDESRILASRLDIIPTKQLTDFLENFVNNEDIKTIVIGIPDSDENENLMVDAVNEVTLKLKEKFPLVNFVKWNETMSSVIAHKNFFKKGKKNMIVDSEAARIILQEYLDFINDLSNG